MGYKRIFVAGKEVRIIDGNGRKNREVRNCIFVNAKESNLFSILGMSPKAVAFFDSRINKKAIEQIKDRGITLCLPLSFITESSELQRSRRLYMMGRLFGHARKMGVDVSFVTLARSNEHLCSYIQLIELAKLIGAEESYARDSISRVNRSLVIE